MKKYLMDNFFKKYMILEKIGWGWYSEVFKVTSYTDGKIYALKVIQKEGLSADELEILNNEFRIMEVLRHQYVIKFYEKVDTVEKYEYIMEYFDGTDLMEFTLNNI